MTWNIDWTPEEDDDWTPEAAALEAERYYQQQLALEEAELEAEEAMLERGRELSESWYWSD